MQQLFLQRSHYSSSKKWCSGDLVFEERRDTGCFYRKNFGLAAAGGGGWGEPVNPVSQ